MKVSIPSHTQIIAASATAGPADSPTNWVDLDLEGHEITFFTTSAEQAKRIADAFNWRPEAALPAGSGATGERTTGQ